MATVRVTDDNFRDLYTSNETLILDFWAPWCGPCQAFGPIFESVSEEYSGVVFGKINTEEENKLSMYFGIRSIPTIVVLRDGIKVFEQPGALSESDLKKVLTVVANLDMDEEKRKIEQEEQA